LGALAEKPDTLVARRAVWGVITRAELRECGLPDDAIKHRVGSGRLHRVYRGVYAVGHPHLTPEGRFLAAVKACGSRAVLSHFSAAIPLGLARAVRPLPGRHGANAARPLGHQHPPIALPPW